MQAQTWKEEYEADLTVSFMELARRHGVSREVIRAAVEHAGGVSREGRTYTTEQAQAWAEQHRTGRSAPSLAKEHGVPYATMRRALLSAGVIL